MAKSGTRESNLFNNHRRQIFFKGGMDRWQDPKDRWHARLQIKMQITSHPLLGMPDFLSDDFTAMEKQDAVKDTAGYEVYMQGMAIDIFPNEEEKTPAVRLTGCELDKFHLDKSGTGENAKVWLHFRLDCANSKILYDFMWEMFDGLAYIVADYDANELPISDTQNDDPDAKQADFFERLAAVAGPMEPEHDEDPVVTRARDNEHADSNFASKDEPKPGKPVVVPAKKTAAKKTAANKPPLTEAQQVAQAKKNLQLIQ